MAETKVSVRSDLLKIVEDLKVIAQTAEQTGASLTEATKEVGKGVNDQVAVVSGGMNKIRSFGKDLVRQLGSDFKNLFAVNAIASGLKLSEQFSGAVRQAVTLNDTIRNLAPIFGMNESAANKFKQTLVKNLSEIGLGSDAAANALQGLAETNVRGDKNLTAYARTASEIASISKQKGQEGTIAKGMANVVVAQGGNPNDPRAMQKVAEDIVRIRNATGKSATEALDTLNKLFSSANTDFKKRLLQGGGVSLAAAGLVGGQGSTAFLERYMGLSKQERSGYEAQGLGRLIGKDGQLDSKAFQSTVSEAKARGSGNAEFGLQTMGMTEEEAKGFLRLANALKENGSAIEKARTSVIDLNQEYMDTMTFGDSFRANINKVKGGLAEVGDKVGDFFQGLATKAGFGEQFKAVRKYTGIEGATKGLGDASQSTIGSAAVVGGSALLAAVLTSKGLSGVGGALLGGELKTRAVEGITGEKVQRVEVINWPAGMGLGGGAAAAGSGVLGAVGKAGLVAGVGYAAYQAGGAINNVLDQTTQGKTDEGYEGSAIERVIFKLDKLLGGDSAAQIMKAQQMTRDVRVHVETKDSSLKAVQKGSRGSSN